MIKRSLYPISVIYSGTLTVLQGNLYRLMFVILFLGFLALYVMLPVWFIPGNDLFFQLSLFGVGEWILLPVLSLLTSLLITMQIYLFARVGKRAFSDGGTGVVSAMMATVVGVTGCIGCSIGIVVGFLGMSTVIFLIQYQFQIAAVAILIFLGALFLIARRIEGYCKECEVSPN